MKKLITLSLYVVLFASCTKNSDNGGPDFAIDGIGDVSMDPTIMTKILPLVVSRPPGSSNQETVSLSVSGLPSGASATFEPASGIPSFATALTFNYNFDYTEEGTHQINIVGTSASGTKTYPMRLIIPEYNGWTVDGVHYTTGNVEKYSSQISFHSAQNQGLWIMFEMPAGTNLPTTTTTYKLVTDATQPSEIGFAYVPVMGDHYVPVDGSSQTATITYSNGQYQVKINGSIELRKRLDASVRKTMTKVAVRG